MEAMWFKKKKKKNPKQMAAETKTIQVLKLDFHLESMNMTGAKISYL